MTGKTASTAVDQVAVAEQQAVEADALVVALEERVRAGDDTITPEQLRVHEDVARFARLQADAARRRAEVERVSNRRVEAAKIVAEVGKHHAQGERLADLLRTIVASVVEFKQLTDAHNAAVSGWLDRAAPLAESGDVDDILAVITGVMSRNLRVADRDIMQINPMHYLNPTFGHARQLTGLMLEPTFSPDYDRVYDAVKDSV
jgi:hypothetical protein